MQGSSTVRTGTPTRSTILAFTRLLVTVIGRPAARRAVPVYAGLAIVYAVVFGPAGLRASVVVDTCRDSVGFRMGLLVGWLVLVLPATARLFRTHESEYLRALPAPAVIWWTVLAALSLALQVPWMGLWIVGASPLEAVGAVTVVAAAAALLSTNARGWRERLTGWGFLAGLSYFAVAQPISLWPIVGVPGFFLSVVISWNRAPDRARPWDPLWVRGGARLALGLTYLAALWRENRSSAGRAVFVGGLGVAAAAVTARTNALVGVQEIAGFSMAIGSVSLAIAAGVLAAPMQQAERDLRWLLDATSTGGATRVIATSGVLTTIMVMLGALHGTLAAWSAGAPAVVTVQVAGCVAAWGGGFALLASRAARTAEARDGVDGTRLVSLVVGLVAVSLALLGWLTVLAVVPWLLAGVAAVATSTRVSAHGRARLAAMRRW